MRWKDERVRRLEERVLLLIADPAERHDVVLLRNLHARRAGEHERSRATGFAVSAPIGQQLVHSLPFAHLSEIQDEGAARGVVLAKGLGIVPRRWVETDPEDFIWDVAVVETRMHEIALLGSQESERTRELK